MNLMRQMVEAGEVDALVAERVWQELAKGLMEEKPSHMFDVLRECGALQRILPELNRLWGVPQPANHHSEVDTGVHTMLVVDYAASQNFSLAIRFAAMMHDLGKGSTPTEILPQHIGHEERSLNLVREVCKRIKVPNDCKELAQIVAKFHGKLYQSLQMKPSTLLSFLIELDAIRQPTRFKDFLKACEADSRGRTGLENCATPAADLMVKVLEAASSIDAGAVAREFSEPEKIKTAVFGARLDAVNRLFKTQ